MKLNEEIISEYLDGALAPAQAKKLEAALKADAKGQAMLKEARRLRAFLRGAAPEAPTARMWAGIRARLAAGEASEPLPQPGFFQRLFDFIAAPPAPAFRWGLAGAAAVFLAFVGVQVMKRLPKPEGPGFAPSQPQEAPEAFEAEVEKAHAQALPLGTASGQGARGLEEGKEARKDRGALRDDLAKSEAPALANLSAMPAPAAPAFAPPPGGDMAAAEPAKKSARMTEVERALLEQGGAAPDVGALDAMVAQVLEQQRRSPAVLPSATVAYQSYAPAPAARTRRSSAKMAGAPGMAMAAESDETFDSATKPAPQPQGRVDGSGFWDFSAAARSLNTRQWSQAEAEFEAASQGAPESAERSFASSALRLLSLPGQPLQGRAESFDELSQGIVVQSAGRWQYFSANRVALYSGSVVARMPGLRSEGAALQMDLSFDRAGFAPGTRFVRLSGAKARVTRVDGSEEAATEFSAPRGADYLLRAGELRLK